MHSSRTNSTVSTRSRVEIASLTFSLLAFSLALGCSANAGSIGTSSESLATSSTALLKPTGGLGHTGTNTVGCPVDDQWTCVSDGTSLSANDPDRYIYSTEAGGRQGQSYSHAPTGSVSQVTTNVVAAAESGASGTVTVKLYSDGKLLATGAAHPLTDAYAVYSDSFDVSVASANLLQTWVTLSSADLKFSEVWLAATLTTNVDAGSDSGGGGTGTVILQDDFNGTVGAELAGSSPGVANLPGGTYQTDYVNSGGTFKAFYDSQGNPAPDAHLYDDGSSPSGSVAISIASHGNYDKPTTFSIQADIAPAAVIMLGFYGTPPASGTDSLTGFTGLAYHDGTGTLDLVEDGVTKTSIAYTGSFNGSAYNTLKYTVDTTTGDISNVTLTGSTSNYDFSSAAFTSSATQYAAFGTEAGGPSGACSYLDNLIVKN
jgi:hypothetical protein